MSFSHDTFCNGTNFVARENLYVLNYRHEISDDFRYICDGCE